MMYSTSIVDFVSETNPSFVAYSQNNDAAGSGTRGKAEIRRAIEGPSSHRGSTPHS
jgi:hypothetical protein